MANTLALVYHNLSIMLDAGVPLLRSLNTVASGSDPRLRAAFRKLADTVSKGNPIAETMAQCPKIFDPLDVMLVQASEESGNLPQALDLLSKWHEFSRRITRKMLSAMMLPLMLIHVTAFVAPLPAFAFGGWQTMPYLITVAKILLLFYLPTAVIFVIVRMTPRTGPARRLLDRLVLKIPVLGRGVYKLALSRYCWAFHMLCVAGLPITDCAEKAASATTNTVVAEMFKPAAASAKTGNAVSEGFSAKLPPDFVDIWRIGEETGQLDAVTRRLADNNGQDAEFWFNEFARWFPRFVYALVCLVMIYYIFRNFSQIMTTMP